MPISNLRSALVARYLCYDKDTRITSTPKSSERSGIDAFIIKSAEMSLQRKNMVVTAGMRFRRISRNEGLMSNKT